MLPALPTVVPVSPRQCGFATWPRALALATQLNKGLGLPYGKATVVLEEAFGLRVSRGGLC